MCYLNRLKSLSEAISRDNRGHLDVFYIILYHIRNMQFYDFYTLLHLPWCLIHEDPTQLPFSQFFETQLLSRFRHRSPTNLDRNSSNMHRLGGSKAFLGEENYRIYWADP